MNFKVWAILPLIFLFALAQTPLLLKHQIEQKEMPISARRSVSPGGLENGAKTAFHCVTRR